MPVISFYTAKPWQRDVHRCLRDHPKDATIAVKAMRQVGKSAMIEQILLCAAMSTPGCTSVVLHPTLKQGRKMFKSVVKAFYRPGAQNLIAGANGTDLILTFANRSEVIFLSAEQGEALRSYTVTAGGVFVIDEAAYISDEIYNICQPYTQVHHTPTVMVSTPRFKTGFFYNTFVMGGNNVYAFDWTTYDVRDMLSDAQREMYRKTMTSQKYRSEVLGEWLDLMGSVFGDFGKILSNAYDGEDHDIFVGIDWGTGTGNDYHALVAMNSKRQMVALDYFNDVEPVAAVERLADKIVGLKPVRVQVEANSIGTTYHSLLVNALRAKGWTGEVVLFNTTNDSKNEIIERLQVMIQNEEVRLFNDPELVSELSTYEQQRTPSGRITYNAENGYHDDIVMALAIALDAMTVSEYVVL